MKAAHACVPSFFAFLLLLAASGAAHTARAQQMQPAYIPPSLPATTGSAPPGSDPVMRSMDEKMAIERNNERQRKIVTESEQLLALAKKLNTDVGKSNQNELSVAVVKEAAEIEKLAKSIKDKMRYGY